MSVNYKEKKDELLKSIDKKRNDMFEIVSIYGINSEKTLAYSQDLDQLIVQYQKIDGSKKSL
ncbi:aspartyl-phosphate phosphatase Spo0E family protein [Oceanobacillus salinisoli]|uniref:aspartyl-phosphate phosphatase Spo0E family protein n=1 Tax=Oceanobacillus salinisoli TaxID=2678611 RepID=UPI0012E315F8|nr:aspartyl-phosphate phosphatase Spo0E family protein [Oceanobacillus salinisoli]